MILILIINFLQELRWGPLGPGPAPGVKPLIFQTIVGSTEWVEDTLKQLNAFRPVLTPFPSPIPAFSLSQNANEACFFCMQA